MWYELLYQVYTVSEYNAATHPEDYYSLPLCAFISMVMPQG